MEESSDGDSGLEALRAGLSAQSSAPQLMPSKLHHLCWECSEGFRTLHDLMEHFDQHQTSGHCQLCQVTFRRGASLAIHLENAHRDISLVCPTRTCRAQLRNRWLLNQHIETCHTDNCVEAGMEVAEEVVEELVVVKEEEMVVEEVVVEEEENEEGAKGEQQTSVPGYVLEHMASEHSYSTRSPDNTDTDHTYNTRRTATTTAATTGHADPRLRHRAKAGEHTNMTGKYQGEGEEGFLVEGAPLQWDEEGDFAEEEVGVEEESVDMGEKDVDSDMKSYNADEANSGTDSNVESLSDDDDDDSGSESESDGDSDSDQDCDSLPPGDSMYVPEENFISNSDSDSMDSTSSGSAHSYSKNRACPPSSGIKQALHTQVMDTDTVMKPSSQTCPHCGLGPFPNLRTHIVKCCSRGPEDCAKCRRVFSEDLEYICVDCKKTFLGSAARKAHICPMKFAIVAEAATPRSVERQHPPPLLTQLPQLYQIVSLLPPGIIYTQAQSVSTSQTSVSPSVNSATLANSNAIAATGTPANNKITNSNSSTPAPPVAAGTIVTIKTQSGTQVGSQTVQSPMLLQAPGLASPSYVPVGNNTSSVVKVFAQTPPKTQVFLRGQTPVSTPASSVTPGFTIVSNQMPSGCPVSTIAHSQAPSGKPVTVVCNQNQVQMPSAVVLCNQIATGVQRFILAPNQGQPRAPMPVVVQNQTPSGAVRPQAPAGAAPTAAVSGVPGVSTATAGGTKPVIHISAPGSETLLFPMTSQPVGAAGPRFSAPAGVSPQASQPGAALSKDSGHPVLSQRQLSTAVSSQVSVSNTVCPVSNTAASTPSRTSSATSMPSPTQNPVLPAVPTQPPASASPSTSGSTAGPLIVLSDSGPLRILFMFLNQSRELALAQRMKTRWHYKEVFSCRQCGAISRQPSLVVLHRYRHRRAPRKHRCHCGRSFQARLHLLRHQLLHAEATRYICTPCGESFEGVQRLLLHKAYCSRAKRRRRWKWKPHLDCWRPFACTCGLKFVRPAALLWHKLNNSRHGQKTRNKGESSHEHCGV